MVGTAAVAMPSLLVCGHRKSLVGQWLHLALLSLAGVTPCFSDDDKTGVVDGKTEWLSVGHTEPSMTARTVSNLQPSEI